MSGNAELLAKFITRQESTAELSATFHVGQDAVDLSATFNVSQQSNWIPQGITYEEYLLRVRSTIIV